MKKLSFVLMTVMIAGTVSANWSAFVIRNANGTNNSPTINDLGGGQTQFILPEGGMKVGLGTNDMNGSSIGDIAAASIERIAIDPAGSYAPYMNIWVTDGQGGYAVLANEPSHPGEYAPGTPYDTTWDILQNATTWVYEVSSSAGFLLPNGSLTTTDLPAGTTNPFTFGDFAGYTIATPSMVWGGSGAPDDLNAATYTAYGFNWVFGDTMSNYVSGDDGFIVANPTVVPEPATLALLGLGGLTLLRKRRA